MRKLPVLISLLVSTLFAYTQDSTAVKWEVSSKKTGNGVFQLTFKGSTSGKWDIYAPDAFFDDIATGGITFKDSSIQIISPLKADGQGQLIKSSLFEGKSYNIFRSGVSFNSTIKISGAVPAQLLGTLQYSYGDDDELYPLESIAFNVKLEGGVAAQTNILLTAFDISKPLQQCGQAPVEEKRGLLTVFLLGFLGGLVALLTPCVFPMIPLTVSFFTKKAGSASKGPGNAILYGLFIFLIYVAFSIPFHIIGKVSPTIYNDIATNIYLNIAFFAVFIFFAVSFFGYYEINLPSGIANRANAKQGSDILGILFMALTLAIVSFSCTGPILGTLLVGTASEGAWPLTAGMAGFGLALGLPFAVFALFPQWLQNLPKSGGWLNTVKVVLGFVELALALKFFSNADLVAHWGILKREIFFALWVLIFFGLFLYLMGWIRFPHDNKDEKPGLYRKGFAIAVLLFTLYIVPGVTNTKWANIGLVSGFPPPHCYSVFKNPVNCDEPLKDFDEAVKLAKETKKPIMIDFTGWACVNCRKMEENVWPKAAVKELMEKYILVSLYVDDKKKLPVTSQFVYTMKDGSQKEIVTVGDKWSTFQTENFNASSQPWYVLITPDLQLLNPPVGYTPDADAFASWLKCGLQVANSQEAIK
jgi:thiol:disulfide interchange protein DsbD